jgi:DNA-binding LacI/PurR family transcriptional regulator
MGARFRPSFRVVKAQNYLVELIAKTRREGRIALPSLAAMARQCGVAEMTMARAVRTLADSGQLEVLGRRGVVLRAPATATSAPVSVPPVNQPATEPKPLPRAEELAGHLIDAIRARTHRSGDLLPTSKQLCTQHDASAVTVRRMLRILEQRRMIVREGRRYRVFRRRPSMTHATLVLVTPFGSLASINASTPWSTHFVHSLQHECSAHNVGLELWGVDAALANIPSAGAPRLPLERQSQSPVLGYVVYNLAMPADYLRRLTALVGRAGAPVAIFDDSRTVPADMRGRHVKVYRRASARACGLELARYLFSLGHRRVAFFSSDRSDPEYRDRYEGMAQAFRDAGCADAVRVHAPAAKPAGAAADSRQLAPVLKKLQPLREGAPWRHDSALLSGFVVGLHDAAGETSRLIALGEQLRRHFVRAAADPQVTAWVGAQDLVALLALSFARESGMRVPGRISIAGIDDSVHAFGQGLTSYSFDIPAIVRAMMNHVVGPRPRRPSGEVEVVDVPGRVVERVTCAPAT